MLVLQNITKDYVMGDTQVHALKGGADHALIT